MTDHIRTYVDNILRPLWSHAAKGLESSVSLPPGARLWADLQPMQLLSPVEQDHSESEPAGDDAAGDERSTG